MSNFKVICKGNGGWERVPVPVKAIQKSSFFGLIKRTVIVSDPFLVNGSSKEEICIVTSEYEEDNNKWYILDGYPYGGYNSKYFIRLDELNETQKEVAEKSTPQLN